MKRKIFALAVLALYVATLAAGTIAFFTSESPIAHNVITTGGIAIELKEWADEAKTKPFENLDNVMPGTDATKIAEVKNTGENPAWVRVKLEKSITLKEGGEADLSLLALDIDTDKWTAGGDGYYYYKDILQPGETTAPLFTKVTFDKTMGNEYQNAKAEITVAAQAVQSANNGETVDKAAGWPGDTQPSETPVTPDPGESGTTEGGTTGDPEPTTPETPVTPETPENP